MLVALAASGSACSTSDKEGNIPVPQFVERETPAEAKISCASPVVIPDRDLSEKEVHDYWGSDRTALRVCEVRRAAAVGGAHVQ